MYGRDAVVWVDKVDGREEQKLREEDGEEYQDEAPEGHVDERMKYISVSPRAGKREREREYTERPPKDKVVVSNTRATCVRSAGVFVTRAAYRDLCHMFDSVSTGVFPYFVYTLVDLRSHRTTFTPDRCALNMTGERLSLPSAARMYPAGL